MQERTSGSRIAHLSDVHILGARGRPVSAAEELTTRFVSFGRSMDPAPRRRALAGALAAARERGAGHVVISGDLTEVGSDPQFEALAEILHESRVDPDRLVLVPGNHDAYTRADAWRRALDGPLAPFRRAAADHHGKVVEREHVTFLPLDVACHQRVTRSAGELSAHAADALARRVKDLASRGRSLVVVLHHPPFEHASRAWQWVDGLRNAPRLGALLESFAELHVLFGHLHRTVDRSHGAGRARVFGASATVEDGPAGHAVRLYDVHAGELVPVAAAPAERAPAALAA